MYWTGQWRVYVRTALGSGCTGNSGHGPPVNLVKNFHRDGHLRVPMAAGTYLRRRSPCIWQAGTAPTPRVRELITVHRRCKCWGTSTERLIRICVPLMWVVRLVVIKRDVNMSRSMDRVGGRRVCSIARRV